MKLILIILVLIFNPITAWSQLPWKEVYAGQPVSMFYDIDQPDDGNIYAFASTQNDGHPVLLRSGSNGDSGTWQNVALPIDLVSRLDIHARFFINRHDMYIQTKDTIWWSGDYAKSWSQRSALPSKDAELAFIPFVNNTIYCKGRPGLYRSHDQGMTWTAVTNIEVYWMAHKGGEIYGFHPAHILKSTNAGANWTKLNATMPQPTWSCFLLLSNDSFMIMRDKNIFLSEDAMNWTLKPSSGFTANVDVCENIVKAPRSDSLFVRMYGYNGKGDELFYSPDGGSTWKSFNSGLPGTGEEHAVVLFIVNGYIFTSGWGSRLYRTSKPLALSTKDIKKPVSSTHIYPNPFTGSFTIEGVTDKKLTLLNILGQRILQKTISSEKDIIETDNLLPGNYILQLTHADGQRESYQIEKK